MGVLHKAEAQIQLVSLLHIDQGARYQSAVYHAFLRIHCWIGSMSRNDAPIIMPPWNHFSLS